MKYNFIPINCLILSETFTLYGNDSFKFDNAQYVIPHLYGKPPTDILCRSKQCLMIISVPVPDQ